MAQLGCRLTGKVIAVRGTVVDVQCDDGLPPLDSALECQLNHLGTITAVVHAHLGESAVRAIAIDSTRGLDRGARVESDGRPLQVPVGSELVGRVIDLRGRPLDGGPPPSMHHALPLRRPPPPPSTRRGMSEVYPTGTVMVAAGHAIADGGKF
jgi:F-type H+-transporting ATPase subunit beta